MKKVLFCASTSSHIKNFHLPYLKAFGDAGYKVFTAAADERLFDDTAGCFVLPLKKSLLSPSNVSAIFAARKLLLKEKFDVISLHTTLAAAVVRAALLTIPKAHRPKVFYICHGYLFKETDGAAALKYLIPEKMCAPVTDVLMVMNDEDERLAKKHSLYKDKLFYINGMGLPDEKFSIPDLNEHIDAKKRLGFDEKDRLFVCSAELSKRKNQAVLIKAFAKVIGDMPNAYLLLAGKGDERQNYEQLCQSLNLGDRVRFLGFVEDVPALLAAADGYLSASFSEGLPFAVMEALAAGLPAALSDAKGHRELCRIGGFAKIFKDEAELCELLKTLYALPQNRFEYELSKFMLSSVLPEINAVYFEQYEKTKEKVGTL